MADDTVELFATPVACDQTTEYENRIADEIEPDEEEERDEGDSRRNWAEIEQQFARYERNYRARRIRELTLAPVKRKRGARRRGSAATGAFV
jgi:hypothetical protein